MNTSNSIGNKRLRDPEDKEAPPSKVLKTDPEANIESALSMLESVSETLNGFVSDPQHRGLIQRRVIQLTQFPQFLVNYLHSSQSFYQFDNIRLLLSEAIGNKQASAIHQYLSEIIKNNDLDRFIHAYVGDIKQAFHAFLDIAQEKSSQELFSTVIQAIHRHQPVFLFDPIFISTMRKVFLSEGCSDLKLTISSKTVSKTITLNINKAYLGYASPYFHQMFFGATAWRETHQSESELYIEDLQSLNEIPLTMENVYDIFRYCYTRTIFFRGAKDCLAILLLAEKWQIKPLIPICDAYLAQSIDTLTDSFEAVWQIAEQTGSAALKESLLDWAVSQHLQGKEVDKNVVKILVKEGGSVEKLTCTLPLEKNQLATIRIAFPNIKSLIFNKLNKDKLDLHISLLKDLKSLCSLEFKDTALTRKAIFAITSTDLKSLKSLSLDNCNFLCTQLKLENASNLHSFKVTRCLTTKGFPFLEKCTNLTSLILDMEYSTDEEFEIFKNLKNLRVLNLYIRSPFWKNGVFSHTLKKLTNLEQLEFNLFSPNSPYSPAIREVQNILDSPKFNLNIFRSNIISNISILQKVGQLKSVMQLSLITRIDPVSNGNNSPSFSLMPSLITFEWDCQARVPFIPFLASLINIQTLHLKNANLTDSVLTQMQQLSHLHTLHLEDIHNLDNNLLANLEHFPWLESLTLTKCDFITDQGLTSLLRSQNLQKVIIQDCLNISEKGDALVQLCEKVREFEFTPFQEVNWDHNRLLNVIRIMPFNLQAIDYMAQSMMQWNIWSHPDQIKLRLKLAVESEPEKYIHWKRLGYIHMIMLEFAESKKAYERALTLGMDRSDFDNAIKKIAEKENERILNQ